MVNSTEMVALEIVALEMVALEMVALDFVVHKMVALVNLHKDYDSFEDYIDLIS
jgi:hypothetical protein